MFKGWTEMQDRKGQQNQIMWALESALGEKIYFQSVKKQMIF